MVPDTQGMVTSTDVDNELEAVYNEIDARFNNLELDPINLSDYPHLDLDRRDDFSGIFSDLKQVPQGLLDGDQFEPDTVDTNWFNLTNVPFGFLDGIDNTLELHIIGNNSSIVPIFGSGFFWDGTYLNVSQNSSTNFTDTVLNETQVDDYVANNGFLTSVSWDDILDIPSGFADGVDNTSSGGGGGGSGGGYDPTSDVTFNSVTAKNLVANGSTTHPTGIGPYMEMYMYQNLIGRLFCYDGSTYYDMALGNWNGGDPNIMLKTNGNVGINDGDPTDTLTVGGSLKADSFKTPAGEGWSGWIDDGFNTNMTYSCGIVIDVQPTSGTSGWGTN